VGSSYAETFNVTSIDGTASTVTVQINGTNDIPTIEAKTFSTPEDTSLIITDTQLLENADDVDLGDDLIVTNVSLVNDANGTLVNNNNGTYTFTPTASYSGSAVELTYTVSDQNGGSAEENIRINVSPIANAPIVEVDADVDNPIISDYKEFTITDYRPIINSGTTTGILEFEGYARSASMSIKSFDGRLGNDTGIVELIKDGQVIKTYSLNDYFTGNPSESTDKLLTFTSDTYFNEVRVSNTSTNDQFKVEDVALVSPYLITYNISADAYLTDASEILSNLIVKVSSFLDGILIVNGVAPDAVLSADGDYNYYSIPASDADVQLIFDHPIDPSWVSAIDSISGSATSWESGDGFALAATSGDDMIVGTLGDDSISGEEGNDVIFGGAGADILSGEDGNDTLAGEDGDDTINGGVGADALYGGTGDDTLIGGDDNDYINGGIGSDTIGGGAGNDTIVYDIADSEVDGGVGADTLIATSGTVNLSNVSNIEVIQLNSGATVIGTNAVLGINANDVMNATDDANTLIIQSVEEGTNTINIDTTSLPFTGVVGGYEIYTNGSVILQVEDDITVI
jgi:Ca2+-binding RTX toxin-like protein